MWRDAVARHDRAVGGRTDSGKPTVVASGAEVLVAAPGSGDARVTIVDRDADDGRAGVSP